MKNLLEMKINTIGKKMILYVYALWA